MNEAIEYHRFNDGKGEGVNYWAFDPILQFETRRIYTDDEHAWGAPRLSDFGRAVGETIAPNADVIDNHGPKLDTYDRYGNVINEVEYHPAQFENERLVYEHGTLHDAFHAPPGRDDPMPHGHSLAMEHLLSYADTGLGCPTGMTAAAGHVLERFDDGSLHEYFEGATARDYDTAMSAAMFLTEKQGGSDVGATETTASRATDGTWRLTGEKWFCSNLDADFIFTLARPPNAPDGTAGLGMFLVPRTTRDGSRNDYYFRRLKDKLGTISVPTGEVVFDDTEAYLLGDIENGFSYMTVMLNRSRLAVAAWSLGIAGRALLESKIHAANREAFGEPLEDKPLMRADLVGMTVDYEAATAVTYEAARQFDRWARGNDEAFPLMRILLSTAKYRAARLGVDHASYATEILGGNGYVNGFVTERLYRDAQVHPIWEGTSNMLCLDVVRAATKEGSDAALIDLIDGWLDAATDPTLEPLRAEISAARDSLERCFNTVHTGHREYGELHAKRITDYVFDVTSAALLLWEAQWAIDEFSDARKALVARAVVDGSLRDRPDRGITTDSTLPIDWFDAITKFESVPPATIGDALEATA